MKLARPWNQKFVMPIDRENQAITVKLYWKINDILRNFEVEQDEKHQVKTNFNVWFSSSHFSSEHWAYLSSVLNISYKYMIKERDYQP